MRPFRLSAFALAALTALLPASASNMLRKLGTTKILLLVVPLALVAGGGVLVYERILGRTVDHPLAEYLPDQTLAYISFSGLGDVVQGEIAAMRPRYPDVERDLTRLMDKGLQLAAQATEVDRDSLRKAVTSVRSVDVAVLRATAEGPQIVALAESSDLLSGWDLWSSLLTKGVIREEEKFEGYTIYSSSQPVTSSRSSGSDLQTFRLYVGLLDKRVLATVWKDPAPLREIMTATVRPPERSLADQPAYRRLAAELGSESHYWAYVSGPSVFDLVRSASGPQAERELRATEPAAGWSVLEAATWGAILDNNWAQGYLNIHSTSATPWYEAFHTPPTSRSLLQNVPKGTAVAVDVGLGDTSDLWKRVDAYMRKVIHASFASRPDAEQRAMREIATMEKFFHEEFPRETGFSFEEDLVAAIGDEVCVAVYAAELVIVPGRRLNMPFSGLILARVKDPAKAKKIEGLLREKVRGEAQWEESIHGDVGMHTLRDASSGGIPLMSYALSEDLLVLASSPDLVKSSLDAGSRGDGMTAQDEIRSSLKKVSSAASAVVVVDFAAYLQLMAGMSGDALPEELKGLQGTPTVVALVEEPRRLSLQSFAPRGYGWNASLVATIEKALDEALSKQDLRQLDLQQGR